MIVGMLASAIVGYTLTRAASHNPPSAYDSVGMVAGGLWAAVPGYLKAQIRSARSSEQHHDELHCLAFSHYLVNGPIKDPNLASPYSHEIADAAKLWRFAGGHGSEFRVNSGIIIAVVAAILIYRLLYKTTKGYEIRAVALTRKLRDMLALTFRPLWQGQC